MNLIFLPLWCEFFKHTDINKWVWVWVFLSYLRVFLQFRMDRKINIVQFWWYFFSPDSVFCFTVTLNIVQWWRGVFKTPLCNIPRESMRFKAGSIVRGEFISYAVCAECSFDLWSNFIWALSFYTVYFWINTIVIYNNQKVISINLAKVCSRDWRIVHYVSSTLNHKSVHTNTHVLSLSSECSTFRCGHVQLRLNVLSLSFLE